MRATRFEFRHRFWLIALCYALAFLARVFDDVNAGRALLDALGLPPDGRALEALFLGGAALATLGAWLRTWASAYLTGAVVHDAALHDERLIADGPYRHVRNPLYLGLLMLAAGQSLIPSRLGALWLLTSLTLLTLRLIGREEAELAARHGEAFRAYAARVPALLPAPTARLPASDRRPDWGDGLLAEAFLWILAAATWIFAVTLDLRLFGLACAAGCALYWPVARFLKRRAGAGA